MARPRGKGGAARAAASVLCCCAPAAAVAGVGAPYAIENAGFERGLEGWTAWTSDGGAHFAPSGGPTGGLSAVRAVLPAGARGSLSRSFPVGGAGDAIDWRPAPGQPGEKVELGAWVWLGADCGAGAVALELASDDGETETTIAVSAALATEAAPRERWLHLHTEALPGFDGRTRPETVALVLRLSLDAAGTVFLDDAEAGRFARSEYPLAEASFELGLPAGGSWTTSGAVVPNDPAREPEAYYGARYAKLQGAGPAAIAQALPLDLGPEPPRRGHAVEAGAWLLVEPGAALGPDPDPALAVELAVWAEQEGAPPGERALVAHARWLPVAQDAGAWTFLQAEPTGEQVVGAAATRLVLELEKTFPGTLRADFVQVGERFALDGNPRRRVGASYVGRYRSPLFPGAPSGPSEPYALWRNWCWIVPPACDPDWEELFHDPDCATSPDCLRPSGRRDGAVSVEPGAGDLPLAGAYDSRDPDVLRYHVALARAAGIDHFLYDWLGWTLAQQSLAETGEALNHETFEALLAAAEQPESDLKVGVMYEPKAHMLGWVQGEPTLEDKKAGMVVDLVWLVERLCGRRAALMSDGRPVVLLFRNEQCDPGGTQCLQEADWGEVRSAVALTTGVELLLVADTAADAAQVFDGLSRWELVDLPLLRYRTFADLVAGAPTWPPVTIEALRELALAGAWTARDWAARDDSARVGIALVWPGFDDSGVGGWGAPNFDGEDGQPVCVRVAAGFEGAFYAETVAAALDGGADWIQVATWNDWNEYTQIEPAWQPGFAAAAFLGAAPEAALDQAVLGRLIETQAWIAAFKDLTAEPGELRRIAAEYVVRARDDPQVTQYD